MRTGDSLRRRSFALSVALVGAFLAAPSFLSAQLVPDGKWWKRPRIAAFIDLTTDQERQLDAIFIRTRPKLIDLKGELEKRELEFQTAMEEGATADRKVIAARIEAREQARAKLQKELLLMVLDMKQVLRAEQWEKLTRMQRELRERRREMKGDRRGLGFRGEPPASGRRPRTGAGAPTPARPHGP